MIFGASLGPVVKKAMGDKAFQTSINKIIDTLVIDPETSNMDAVVLGTKDFSRMMKNPLISALKNKHPNVGVLVLYHKDKDVSGLEELDIKVRKVSKVTPDLMKDSIESLLEKVIRKDSRQILSSDETIPQRSSALAIFQSDSTKEEEQEEVGEVAESETKELTVDETLLEEVESNKEVASAKEIEVKPDKSLEERIGDLAEYPDWELFKQSLEKDAMMRELARENTEYAGVVNMLDALDRKIYNVFTNKDMTSEDKFQEIKSLGVDRASYKGIQDNIIAGKVVSIMEAIVRSAEKVVDNRVESVKKALDTLTSSKLMYQRQDIVKGLIDERLKIQVSLMELSKEIIEMYKVMDSSVDQFIKDLDKGLPSENVYINEMMKPYKHLFTPSNVPKLVSKLMSDLQNNRVSMSMLEAKLSEVIKLVFQLCEADSTIIEFQQRQIELLKANRVEDVVILDSMLKSTLRLFVGPSDIGRTATALTWGGVLSKRHNTLLIDLSGSSKFDQYGVDYVNLDDFMNERIEKQFLCVVGDLEGDIERVDEIIKELNYRLNYYNHINIILSAGQIDILASMAKSALVVHFISNCTPRSNSDLKPAIQCMKEPNVAKKLILIDPPVEASIIMNDLEIDQLTTKLMILPRLQYIAASSIRGTSPYDSQEVIEVFEEAFR